MKKAKILWLTVVFLLLVAGKSMALKTVRSGGCVGILAEVICSGTPVTITGQVVGVSPGHGYLIDTGQETVLVCGFGPIWYWKRMGITRPLVGENVIIQAYEVSLSNGKTVTIATKVTTEEGQTIQLRDPQTCLPLWFKRTKR